MRPEQTVRHRHRAWSGTGRHRAGAGPQRRGDRRRRVPRRRVADVHDRPVAEGLHGGPTAYIGLLGVVGAWTPATPTSSGPTNGWTTTAGGSWRGCPASASAAPIILTANTSLAGDTTERSTPAELAQDPAIAAVLAEDGLDDLPAPTVPTHPSHATPDQVVVLGQAQQQYATWYAAGVGVELRACPASGILEGMRSREQRWQHRLALPVLIAALISVPAVFLTFADGPLGVTGRVLDLLSGFVLLVVAEDRRAWIRGHLGLILLTLLVVLGVVFAIGPVQVLRLVRTVGALRVLRAGRIVKAARQLAARSSGWLLHGLTMAAGLVVAVFVGLVLADPTSRSRSVLAWVLPVRVDGPVVVGASVLAGLALGAATWVLVRDTGSGADADEARTER